MSNPITFRVEGSLFTITPNKVTVNPSRDENGNITATATITGPCQVTPPQGGEPMDFGKIITGLGDVVSSIFDAMSSIINNLSTPDTPPKPIKIKRRRRTTKPKS